MTERKYDLQKALRACKLAATDLAKLSGLQRSQLAKEFGLAIQENQAKILKANTVDLKSLDTKDSLRDRLLLNESRLKNLAPSANVTAKLPDVLGTTVEQKILAKANGDQQDLKLRKITVPLGVVAMIYESRPNVTFDMALAAIKSGNGVVLRGGSDAYHTNQAIVTALQSALKKFNISKSAITLLPPDRNLVDQLLKANYWIDLLIPRGSEDLIQKVRSQSTIPVIETGRGVCHTYVSKSADLAKATAIVLNAKLQRPTVCNALDTLLVDESIAKEFLPMLVQSFKDKNVEIHADAKSCSILSRLGYQHLRRAKKDDFGYEYLGFGCSIKTVNGIREALDHIAKYSSKHTEVIVSQNDDECQQFLSQVDAGVVSCNASSRLADAEVFGLGSEVGISTQKMHTRGPFGYTSLVTQKWILKGDGHVRT